MGPSRTLSPPPSSLRFTLHVRSIPAPPKSRHAHAPTVTSRMFLWSRRVYAPTFMPRACSYRPDIHSVRHTIAKADAPFHALFQFRFDGFGCTISYFGSGFHASTHLAAPPPRSTAPSFPSSRDRPCQTTQELDPPLENFHAGLVIVYL